MVRKVARETAECMSDFKTNFVEKYKINISNKLTSELVGKIFETRCESIFSKSLGYAVRREASDKDPDLYFTRINRPLEVKLTSTLTAWTGGEFSKRPFDYLLVSWGGSFDEYFVALVRLVKKDWKSNYQKKFYGPSYSAKKLYERKDKKVFMGDFKVNESRGSVKIVRERI
ncbi:MAG: hypothetical protein QXT68_03070 [Halobacteria archaeon]